MENKISYSDPIFDDFSGIQGFDLDSQIDLINSSPLLVDLLLRFKTHIPPGTLTYNSDTEPSNSYNLDKDDPIINIVDISGNNFTRILSHELGHAFDQLVKGTITEDDKDFSTIISTERDESEATAISFIVSRQIKANSPKHVGIGISNRVYLVDPQIQSKLESKYGAAIDAAGNDTQALWSLATRMADDIWGLNFRLRPHGGASRWEKLLTATYKDNDGSGEIPEFLQPAVRELKSARINESGQYEFRFVEKSGSHAGSEVTYVYGADTGGSDADLVVGGDGACVLSGGAGDDVLVGNWTRLGEKDTVGDILDGGAGDDVLKGGAGNDKLTGGAGADEIYGGAGDDTIYFEGSDSYSDTVIDGGAGSDTLKGSDGGDDLDLSRLTMQNVEKIDLAGGDDTLTVHGSGDLGGVTSVDGGAGRDTVRGTDAADDLDLSVMNASGFEEVRGGAGGDTIVADDSGMDLYGEEGDDVITGGAGADEIYGEAGSDTITSGAGNDVLYGGDDSDSLSGGDGDDLLYGGEGDDQLSGGAGDDRLYAGHGSDILQGGSGYDTYYITDGDTVSDADGSGRVIFYGALSGGKEQEAGSGVYYGNGGEYRYGGSGLVFTGYNGLSLTIAGFSNGDLGIHLKDKDDPDPPEEPNDQDFSSPLVLDLNNNGRTSTSLMMSETHFDLDGDGFAERTGWIEADDGLLALDRNQNGVIDSGAELFGNHTPDANGNLAQHGFDALDDYDSNHDRKIDASDEVFHSLSVWVDANQDGISQEGELRSLGDLHIQSINLDAQGVNGEEERNQVSQEATVVVSWANKKETICWVFFA